jgi:signal transduction histidine kinase
MTVATSVPNRESYRAGRLPEGGGPWTVLIADDMEDIRMLARQALQRDPKFEVVAEAEDGVASIREAARHRPDIVLLDIAMPVMTGLEAIPAIRERSPGTRIVVLSVHDAERVAEDSIRSGADAFLEKTAINRLAPFLHDVVAGRVPKSHGAMVAPASPPQAPPPDDAIRVLVHELMSPVAVIERLAETVRDEEDLPPERLRELIDSLQRNAAHLGSLIRSLSVANRLERRVLDLHEERFDMSVLASQSVEDMAELLRDRAVRMDLQESLRTVADPTAIREVISNLLTNAAKFSPPDAPISVSLRQAGSAIELSVTDACGGIPADGAARVFERFTRLSEGAPGLGLGLYVAREIARAHGGDLRLDPRHGAGCRFTLAIPDAINES